MTQYFEACSRKTAPKPQENDCMTMGVTDEPQEFTELPTKMIQKHKSSRRCSWKKNKNYKNLRL